MENLLRKLALLFILAGKHARRRRLSLQNHLSSAKSGNFNTSIYPTRVLKSIQNTQWILSFNISMKQRYTRIMTIYIKKSSSSIMYFPQNKIIFCLVGNSRHHIIYVPNEASHLTLRYIFVLHSTDIMKRNSRRIYLVSGLSSSLSYMCFQNSLQLIP